MTSWAKLGLGTKCFFISKYSIYHVEQPPPRFIWVKTTLKWTKCPKTAQIVEKWQNGVILGLKCHHRAKWGLGMKKNYFKVFHLSC